MKKAISNRHSSCAPSTRQTARVSKTCAAVLLGGLVLLAGCGTSSAQLPSGQGVVRLPLLASGQDAVDGMAAVVTGTLSLEGGCLRVGKAPAVWPKGTTWDTSAKTVTLPSGATIELGTTVRGGGGYISGEPVSDMFGDEVRAAVRTCAGTDAEVAVLNATPEPTGTKS